VEIQTGRIDFYNLNFFNYPEVELLRNYLNKNHAYRTGTIKPEYTGIIDDNFLLYGEIFTLNGWINFSGILGSSNIKEDEFMRPFNSSPVLWAYGCGAGYLSG